MSTSEETTELTRRGLSSEILKDLYNCRDDVFLAVINTVLKTDFSINDITKEIVKEFNIVSYNGSRIYIAYRGKTLGEIKQIDYDFNDCKLGFEFIPTK